MSIRNLLLVSILLLTINAQAEQDFNKITSSQIASFKNQIKSNCYRAGIKRGETEDYAKSVCNCVVKLYSDNISNSDWKKVISTFLNTKMQIQKIPQIAKVTPKLKSCS